MYTSVYDLPVANLLEPPSALRVRDEKKWYVEYLEEMMSDVYGDHEDLTAPLLVLSPVATSEFAAEDLTQYKFTVSTKNNEYRHYSFVLLCHR